MKKISIVFGALLSLSILVTSVVPVFAHSDGTTHTESDGSVTKPETETETEKTTEDKPKTPEELAKKAAEMKKRVEENKTKVKSKIDEATKKRITAKCKPAQNVVQGAQTSANAITTNRTKAYAKVNERVQKLIDKLKANNIDATELETALAGAKTKAEAVGAALKTYEQTLADLQAMDCTADPAAFAATLETARTQRDAVKAAAKDLRTYMSTTLKAAIVKVKPLVEAAKTEDNSSSTEGTR